MRVLMVNAYGRLTGGADKHCFDLAELLRGAGHDVTFLATRDAKNQIKDGAFVPRTVGNDTRDALPVADRINTARRAVWNRTAEGATRRLITLWKPDVVHVHNIYPQLSVAPVVVAHESGVPVVQHLHDYQFVSATYTDPGGGWRDRVDTQFAYRALNTVMYGVRRARHVGCVRSWITVSRSAAAHYAAHGIHPRVLPNFVPLGSAPASTRRFDDRGGVLYFGRLVPEKGVAHVLDLAAHLRETVRVLGSGPLATEVERAATRIANLEFWGPQPHSEVQQQIANARVVVMPSLWEEPGPLAALEAMASGTPVVTYPAGGLSEYVADAGSGAVVDPDPAALRASVQRFLMDRQTWQRASEAGRVAAQSAHSADHYMRSILNVYRDAVDNHRSLVGVPQKPGEQ